MKGRKPAEGGDFFLKEETYRILGACFEVYNEKGHGFAEALYQECLEIELEMQGIPAVTHPSIELAYKGRKLKQRFVPDLVCFGNVVVELKVVSELTDSHRGQILNYLKATGKPVGLLVNFASYPRLESMRVVAHDSWRSFSASEPADLHS